MTGELMWQVHNPKLSRKLPGVPQGNCLGADDKAQATHRGRRGQVTWGIR